MSNVERSFSYSFLNTCASAYAIVRRKLLVAEGTSEGETGKAECGGVRDELARGSAELRVWGGKVGHGLFSGAPVEVGFESFGFLPEGFGLLGPCRVGFHRCPCLAQHGVRGR